MEANINTQELFRLLSLSIGKEKPASAYAVAKALGCTQSAAKNWELGARVMDEKYAGKAAEILGLNLEFVILSLEAEKKSKSGLDEIAAIFTRAALAVTRHGQAASLGYCVTIALLAMTRTIPELCILCKTRYQDGRLKKWLLDVWDGPLPFPA